MKQHFSETLRHSAWLSGWLRTWSWISWLRISLYMSMFLLGSLLPAPADPNSILLCRNCTCMWFQVSFPMRELHGRRNNALNCSYHFMLSVLKQRSYIRCEAFFQVVSTQEQDPSILIAHQISMWFLMCRSVAPHAISLKTLCSCSSLSSMLSFLPFVMILANICSTFIVI